ncbi:hypothetical protein AX774_g88 [Zancudomyces culisetae]|uniref:Uncharacterized protein n=1 Tax=Zancudomyces culisetae TaxID=1213189 RepID=A0A1R1PZE5_ZANCU|nr:hypothetical protein AX774_g88 [Zancudomyces culisetae]|eukprot:OMH86330.1 hypothetical protein AX774_g88 [Zancudomyces culisetae]
MKFSEYLLLKLGFDYKEPENTEPKDKVILRRKPTFLGSLLGFRLSFLGGRSSKPKERESVCNADNNSQGHNDGGDTSRSPTIPTIGGDILSIDDSEKEIKIDSRRIIEGLNKKFGTVENFRHSRLFTDAMEDYHKHILLLNKSGKQNIATSRNKQDSVLDLQGNGGALKHVNADDGKSSYALNNGSQGLMGGDEPFSLDFEGFLKSLDQHVEQEMVTTPNPTHNNTEIGRNVSERNLSGPSNASSDGKNSGMSKNSEGANEGVVGTELKLAEDTARADNVDNSYDHDNSNNSDNSDNSANDDHIQMCDVDVDSLSMISEGEGNYYTVKYQEIIQDTEEYSENSEDDIKEGSRPDDSSAPGSGGRPPKELKTINHFARRHQNAEMEPLRVVNQVSKSSSIKSESPGMECVNDEVPTNEKNGHDQNSLAVDQDETSNYKDNTLVSRSPSVLATSDTLKDDCTLKKNSSISPSIKNRMTIFEPSSLAEERKTPPKNQSANGHGATVDQYENESSASSQSSPRVQIYGSTVSGNRQYKKDIKELFKILTARSIRFEYICIAADQKARSYMKRKSLGNTNIPQIYVDGEFKGFYKEAVLENQMGTLNQWLGLDREPEMF